MGYSPVQVFTVSAACGITFTSVADLGKSQNHITLEIPTMTSGTDLFIQGSSDNSTWRRVYHPIANGTAAPAAQTIGSAVTNCHLHLGNVNLQYLKVELASAPTTGGHTFKFICAD